MSIFCMKCIKHTLKPKVGVELKLCCNKDLYDPWLHKLGLSMIYIIVLIVC